MIKLKNDKGVTLIILTITIIALLIITGIMIESSNSQLTLKYVSNLYSDIDSISTKVSDYYLKNNSLPIFENNIYLNNSNELETLIKKNGGDKSVINVNDDGPYYVLKLSKLENLTLNYGKEYKLWDDTSTSNEYQDLYIINGVTHQIYYPKGIKYKDTIYFGKKSDSTLVEKINTDTISDEFEIVNVTGKKNKLENSDQVIVSADVSLNIGSNYKRDTLKYAWQVYGDDSNIEYSQFMTDDLNSASVMSKTINNSDKYVLYFKIMDVSGNEHIISKEVAIMESPSVGDYIEYDVAYTDMYPTTRIPDGSTEYKTYTKKKGWRILRRTKNESNGTYDLDIVSTGIPVKLFYYSGLELKPVWSGTSEQATKYATDYYGTATDANVIAVSGLTYNFAKVIFTGNSQSSATNVGYYKKIAKNNGEKVYEGDTITGDIFVIREGATVRAMMHTDLPGITGGRDGKTISSFGTASKDTTGLFKLDNLGYDRMCDYWLASPGWKTGNICRMNAYFGEVDDVDSSSLGIRPVISMTGIQLKPTTAADGTVRWQITN